MVRWFYLLALLVQVGAWKSWGQSGDRGWEDQPDISARFEVPAAPALSPKQALASFRIADGFSLKLVAHEPMVQDPVKISFDEFGRLWVLEMRGFMPNIEGHGEGSAVGRISVLEDQDRNGVYDKSRVFVEGLVLPRVLTLAYGGVIFSSGHELLFAKDINGDLRADVFEVLDTEYIHSGNPEHQPNGMLRALDNWYYNAKSNQRYRRENRRWIKEETEFRGQWGMAQDNEGRLFYNYNWDQLRADIAPPNSLNRHRGWPSALGYNVAVSTNQTIHPIRITTGVNRAYRPDVLDRQGRLTAFTAACSPWVYRGHGYPDSYQNNVFVCGPGGHVVKRNIVVEQGLQLVAHDAYSDRDMVASSDERFRPVNLETGPDGSVYIVDMYRGIIQHRAYMTSHLRSEIRRRDLERPIHMGRIYRLESPQSRLGNVGDSILPGTGSADLWISLLSHPNGWTRDTAQRLLVESGHRDLAPGLIRAIKTMKSPLGRIHALWVLEGWDDRSIDSLLPLLGDSDSRVQVAAIRVIDSLSVRLGLNRDRFLEALLAIYATADLKVQFHSVLAAHHGNQAWRLGLLQAAAKDARDNPLMLEAVLSSSQGVEMVLLERVLMSSDDRFAPMLQSLIVALLQTGDALAGERLYRRLQSGVDFRWQREAIAKGFALVLKAKRFKPLAVLETDEEGGIWPGWEPLFLERLERVFVSRSPDEEVEEGGAVGGTTSAEDSALEPLRRHQSLLYRSHCASCHGLEGEGLKPLAPPLIDSEWIAGEPKALVAIILQGLEGPIHVNGQRYAIPNILPAMPGVGHLDSGDLTHLINFMRQTFSGATPISAREVNTLRLNLPGRTRPWTENELLALLSKKNNN